MSKKNKKQRPTPSPSKPSLPLPCRGKPHTLSVCMIVKNEEANIERAIRSFLPFADEIVVNDTGSTDKTLEIVRSLPKTKIIQSIWKSDFSYSRNLSLDAATSAWCLWMDADDFVPADQAEHFNKLKTAPLDRAFAFQICNTLQGKPVGVRFLQMRMFPNHPRIRFQGKIHEQATYTTIALGLRLYNLETAIWHLGYETLEIRQLKARRNLEIQLADPDHAKSPIGLLQLGDSYGILGDHRRSIEFYKLAFEFPDCARVHSDIYRTVPDNIGRQYQHLEEYAEAELWFRRSAELFPGRPDPIFYLGDLYRITRREEEAQKLFAQALDMPVTLTTTGTRHDIVRMHCYKYLCEYQLGQGLYDTMHSYAARFHQEYPDTLEGHYFYGLSLLRLGRAEEAAQVLADAYAKNPRFSKDLLMALSEAYAQSGNAQGMAQMRSALQSLGAELGVQDKAPLLSLCMIVKNEEANLAQCLKSAQGLADEIIVVDTGSSDSTIELARAAGARVEHFAWIKDFAAARNYSISFATGKWILWLDADDRVPEATVKGLKDLLKEAPTDRFYALAVKNTTDQGLTGTSFSQIRLFPNHKGGQFRGRIHEQLFQSLEEAGLTRTELSLEIFHTGYTDPATIATKQQRNLEIFRAEFPDPEAMNPLDLFHYAATHENTGDRDGAIKWLRRSLEISLAQNNYEPLQIMLPAKIASLLANQGKTSEAMEMLDAHLVKYPRYEESVMLKAQLLAMGGKPSEALRWYGYASLFRSHSTFLPLDFRSMRLQGFKSLADYWHARGEQELGLSFLRLAKNLADEKDPPLLSTAELYFEHEHYGLAVENLEFARPLCEDSEAYCLLLGKSLALSGKLIEAREWIAWSRKKWPVNEELKELAGIIG